MTQQNAGIPAAMADHSAENTLDTSGLTCPMPILKTKKALAEMSPGALLEVVATDPAAPADFDAFCRASGHTLIESGERADAKGTFRFVIQRCT